MAPVPSRRAITSQSLSQKAIATFRRDISKERQKDGQIKAPDAVIHLKTYLQAQIKSSNHVSTTFVSDLVGQLGDVKNNLCNRFEPTLFYVILRVILQADESRCGEHGLYLLASSLHQDRTQDGRQRLIEARHDLIFKECFQGLLTYFVDAKRRAGMRRLVGAICIELLKGSENNNDRLGLMPDDLRQQIGPLMIQERHEHVRLMTGEMVRNLLKAGSLLSSLFRKDFDSSLYEDFPDSTQNDKAWITLFDNYIDKVVVTTNQVSTGALYFGYRMTLDPEYDFGITERNVSIFVCGNEMSIMATPSDTTMIHTLDIPLSAARIMNITTPPSVQGSAFVDMMIQFAYDEDNLCFLDATSSRIRALRLIIAKSSAEALEDIFRTISPQFMVSREIQTQGRGRDMDDGHYSPGTGDQGDLSSSQLENMPRSARSQRWTLPQTSTSQEPIELGENQTPSALFSPVRREHDLTPTDESFIPKIRDGSSSQVTFEAAQVVKPPQLPTDNATLTTLKRTRIRPKGKAPIVGTQRTGNYKDSGRQHQLSSEVDINGVFNETKIPTVASSSKSIACNKVFPRVIKSDRLAHAKRNLSMDNTISAQPISEKKELGKKSATPKTSVPTKVGGHEASTASLSDLESPRQGTNDASTSKKGLTPEKRDSISRPKKPMLSEKEKSNFNNTKDKPKRYFLPKQATKNDESIFDVPDDDEQSPPAASSSITKGRKGTKRVTKSRKSNGASKNKTATNATAKAKRKSAPAILAKHTVPLRSSQRAAAAKANLSMQNTGDNEEDVEEDESIASNETAQERSTQSTKATPAEETIKNRTTTLASSHIVDAEDDQEHTSQRQARRSNKAALSLPERQHPSPNIPGKKVVIPDTKAASLSKLLRENQSEASAEEDVLVVEVITDAQAGGRTPDDKQIIGRQLKSTSEPATTKVPALSIRNGNKARAYHEPLEYSIVEGNSQNAVSHLAKEAKDSANIEMADKLDSLLGLNDDESLSNKFSVSKQRKERSTEVLPASTHCEQGIKASEPISAIPTSKPDHIHEPIKAPEVVVKPTPIKPAEKMTIELDRKRKSGGNSSTHLKKLCSASGSCSSPLRRSPRLQERNQKKASPVALVSKSPLLNSPKRLPNAALPDVARNRSPVSALLEDTMIRKQQLISFDATGPLNQGMPSVRKQPVESLNYPKKAANLSPVEPSGLKRKREEALHDDKDNNLSDPPKKRTSSSPAEIAANPSQSDTPLHIPSSPPEPTRRRFVKKRQSSQSSRVDRNGSPLPPKNMLQVNHIGKLEIKLSNRNMVGELQAQNIEHRLERVKQRRLSDVFGPKIPLESQRKARPSSPSEVVERYVAHKKTANGQYETINTKVLIEEQEALADPFSDQAHKYTGFTERLQSKSAKMTQSKVAQQTSHHHKVKQNDFDETELPQLPRRDLHRVAYEDEKTLIKENSRLINELSGPSELKNASTNEESSQPSRTPLIELEAPNDMWNVAIRPHYNDLRNAIHRIADEVVLHLSDEEDKMGLLVESYSENGTKLVEDFQSKRQEEKMTITKGLECRTTRMLGVYRNAKDCIEDADAQARKLTVSGFEKIWSKEQEDIENKITNALQKSIDSLQSS